MPNGPIDPSTGPAFVLEGRVVTMSPSGTLSNGAVYIGEGQIVSVQDNASPAPPGFGDALRIRTGDTIYPGLIELHNHLCYNAMPLWDVPRKYSNNGQWKNHPDYRRLITKPSQVLGRTPGIVEALIRFVECRCLLGGVTTSQGITLSSAGGIRKFYRGIVRNVEQTDEPALPEAGTRIANPDKGKAAEYLETLNKNSCYLQHLSEGVDETARKWFHRLQLENGEWAITEALCGIHSSALHREDLEILRERGGSIVWSPLSNFLLYGGTLDVQAVKDSGIRVGIGCDWAPSGSKNLLGELKVAWLANQEAGSPFSPEEIVAMATRDAARILKWDSVLGTIEAGKKADLIAVNGQEGDDFLRLINARETTVTLVVINGVPRVGQRRLMKPFGPGTEEIRVGRSMRVLNLKQPTSHPLVEALTLGEASDRLRTAMRDLPVLAEALDNARSQGLFAGSIDAQGTAWQVAFDFDEEEDVALAAQPLAAFVEPMQLDEITVADDPVFLARLVAARNLPEFVKKQLPGLYGRKMPLPPGAVFLRRTSQPLPPQILKTTGEMRTFLKTWGELSLGDRKTIVDQGLVLLEENYVHLPHKRAMHAVDPVQRLKLLRHRLEQADEGELSPEIEFHNEVASAFDSLRDLHTTYRLPAPFKQKTAWLPFLIEECQEHARSKFLVTRVVGDAGPPEFTEGVEVEYWNGMPIQQAIARNAERQAGSNPAARHARAVDSLTIRPLARGWPPEEEWVTLRFRDLDGRTHEWSQDWLVFEPGRTVRSLDPEALVEEAAALGLDAQTDDIQEAKKVLYAGAVVMDEMNESRKASPQPISNSGDGLTTFLPTVFRAREVFTRNGRFGYLRIFTFNVQSAETFLNEFSRLLQQLPQNGLIIDVRGNGGGLIHAAERLLQFLTPQSVEPEKAQFINTPLNLRICRNFETPTGMFPGFALTEWIPSMQQSVETGATYSLGFPITPPDQCNNVGQKYYGPVLLIVDALCYSATDIFAAGFKDHGIGPILGTSANTGAGGANVWSHHLLQLLAQGAAGEPSPYKPLANGADLRVAVRRTVRVGPKAGTVVEDLGIRPDFIHEMTRKDILGSNEDLIEEAGRILSQYKAHPIEFEWERRPGSLPLVRVKTANISRLDLLVQRRPKDSFDVVGDETPIDLEGIVGSTLDAIDLEFRGYEGETLVAVRRERVEVD